MSRPRARCRRTGKLRFVDRVSALLAIAEIKHRDNASRPTEQRAYQCAHCRGWHLTHMALNAPKGDQK